MKTKETTISSKDNISDKMRSIRNVAVDVIFDSIVNAFENKDQQKDCLYTSFLVLSVCNDIICKVIELGGEKEFLKKYDTSIMALTLRVINIIKDEELDKIINDSIERAKK